MSVQQDKPRLTSVVPVFDVPDVVRAAEYYRDVLGFTISGYFADPPVFAIVWRDNVEFFFGKSNTPPHPNSRAFAIDAYVRINGVRELHDELKASGAEIVEAPTEREYNQTELTIRDLHGFTICFGEQTHPDQ